MGAYSGSGAPSQARKVPAGALVHHVLEWPAAEAAHGDRGTVFLLHGYMDVAASWEDVAPRLAQEGFRVLAPDLRGFGDAPRAAAGSSYYFSDYIADLADLADELAPDAPLALVGHSMGGVVATLYAGSFPSRVVKLANLEGLGPPASTFADAPERMREFVTTTRKYRGEREERSMADLEEVLRRLTANHPSVAPDVLRRRAPHLVRAIEGGRFAWRFDPLHRARSPFPFYRDAFGAFAARVACPVLFVSGGPAGWHPADEGERLAAFSDLRRDEIEGAGHMMHWTRPNALAEKLSAFLA